MKTPPRPSKGPHMIKDGDNKLSRKIVQLQNATQKPKQFTVDGVTYVRKGE
jgi:hypothetical protein